MNKHTVITQFNYIPVKGTENNEESQTIPDDSMSLGEVLRRWQVGLPINGTSSVFYEEEELPDIQKMDLEEIAQMAIDVEDTISEYRKTHSKAEAKKFAEQQYKEFEERYKKENTPPDPAPPSGAGGGSSS